MRTLMYTLIISSAYSVTVTNHEHLNNEVTCDSATVKALFPNHRELMVPAGKLSRNTYKAQKINMRNLVAALKDDQEQEVSIVLNTHGAPGTYDIDTLIIKDLVALLSAENIQIKMIYALMCDGFTKKKSIDSSNKYKTPYAEQVTFKPSAMAVLRDKLNHLETDYPQSFDITGFKSAYEPSTDKNMVVDLLLGNKQGETAHVFTRQRKKKNFETLLQYINLCRDVHNKQCMDYIKVTNELGKTLHSIAQDIRNYLEGYCELEPASITLYQNLFDQSHVEPEKKPSVSEFEYRYKKWLKENKMTSAKRLNVLVAYCSYNLEQAVDMRPYNNNKFFRPISPLDSPSDCSKCDVDDLVLKP